MNFAAFRRKIAPFAAKLPFMMILNAFSVKPSFIATCAQAAKMFVRVASPP